MAGGELRGKIVRFAKWFLIAVVALVFASCLLLLFVPTPPKDPAALQAEKAAREAQEQEALQRQAEEQAEAEQREADAAAAKAELVEKLCTEEMADSAGQFLTKTEGRDAFVDGASWDVMPYDARVGLARWYSVCHADGRTIRLRHGNTGKELATYTLGLGYKIEE